MHPIYLIIFAAVFLILFSIKMKMNENKLRDEGFMPIEGQETMEHVQMLVDKGYKIEAIKMYRKIKGVDLKEAKEVVDKMVSERIKSELK